MALMLPGCFVCNSPDVRLCAECRTATYCSIKCQEKDYKSHDRLCRSFRTLQRRPRKEYRRGIFFSDASEWPRWCWIRTESQDGQQILDVGRQLVPGGYGTKMNPFASTQQPLQSLIVKHNQSRRRALHDPIILIYLDQKDEDGSPVNGSVELLASDVIATPWFGPILAMKASSETGCTTYVDMGPRDYRDVLDSLHNDFFPTPGTVSQGEGLVRPLYSAPSIQGVRISCIGDTRVLGADKFLPVSVSVLDPLFEEEMSNSCDMIGVPLRVRRLPMHLAWREREEADVIHNPEAAQLFREIDPEEDRFGYAPADWESCAGSVIVARDDNHDITPQQVEALCYYHGMHTDPKFWAAEQEAQISGSMEEMYRVQALFHPDEFRKFFADFKAMKVQADTSWEAVESPV